MPNAGGREPLVWVLFGPNSGDNRQLRALADAVGWPYEAKELAWDNPRQARHLASASGDWRTKEPNYDRARSSPLSPPWPDLVLVGDLLCSWVALWIQRQSGNRTRLVRLGNPVGPIGLFDLIIAAPQFGVPPRPNVIPIPHPIGAPDAAALGRAAAEWTARLGHLPRPWYVLFVGGSTKLYPLDPQRAETLARQVEALRARGGGSVLVSTSPRTPASVLPVLDKRLAEPRFLYGWRPNDPDNPYEGLLALGDEFVVTPDSASMLAEACATGKPVRLFLLRSPFFAGVWLRHAATKPLVGLQRSGSQALRRAAARLQDWLHARGIIRYDRDLTRLHRDLIARGLVSPLAEPTAQATGDVAEYRAAAHAALGQAAARIRALWPGAASAAVLACVVATALGCGAT